MQEVAVVQRLQAEVVELQVARRVERGAQLGQVELLQLLVQQLGLDATLDERGEVLGVARAHLFLQHFAAEDLAADRVQQQAGGGARVARLLLDQRARGQDGGLVDLVDRHAVVQVATRLGEHRIRRDVGAEVGTRRHHQRVQVLDVERHALALVDDEQLGLGHLDIDLAGLQAILRAALAIEHVGTGDLMMAAAHQAQLDLVLDVFDVEGAAGRTRTQQRTHDALGQAVDGLAHAGRGRALRAVNGQESLHQRDRDLARLERHDRAVAAQDLVALVGGIGARDRLGRRDARCGAGLIDGGCDSLHGDPSC